MWERFCEYYFLIWTVIESHGHLYWSNSNCFFFFFFHLLMSFLDKKCLTPLLDTEKPTILDTTNTSFTLSLPSVTTQQLCPSISQPTPTYLVFFREITSNHENSTYHFSTLQQKTLVCLFWNKNACATIYNRECDITSNYFINRSVTFHQGIFLLLQIPY